MKTRLNVLTGLVLLGFLTIPVLAQVDSVAESMVHTEEAIRELNQITGLADEMEETPSILQSDLSREYE